MSIQAYSGEFTISPIPLEMSMNYCSHACSYCFANLNQPDRKLDVNKTINQIKNAEKGKGLTSYLIREKYPILLSNRVDPFAHSNWRQTLSFLEIFNEFGNQVAFQTRGGQGVDEALALIAYKANWYITFNIWDDNIRQVVEPGAPSVKQKLALIEKLISNGHHVSVGINPLVEEWLPTWDFEELVSTLSNLGVKNFWLETLHLNSNQVKKMSKREYEAIGTEIITEASKRNRNTSYFMLCHEYLIDKGMNVYSMNQPIASDYFSNYKIYKTIPTHQDFINYCFKKYPKGGEIKWNEYYAFMKMDFYDNHFSEADGYLYRIARNVWKDLPKDEKPLKTLKQVLENYWIDPRVSKSLLTNGLFSLLSYKEAGKDLEYLCNEDGMPIYYFNGFDNPNYRVFV